MALDRQLVSCLALVGLHFLPAGQCIRAPLLLSSFDVLFQFNFGPNWASSSRAKSAPIEWQMESQVGRPRSPGRVIGTRILARALFLTGSVC